MAVQQMRPPGGADDGRAHSHASYRSRVRTGASLSALYLTRPQRLVGCSLPPQAKSPTNGGHATKGFVTLAVPHILESAATTQTLPATSLVRFRWRREESQRGSLFQPARITNDRGLHAPRDHSDEDTETGGEGEAKQGAQRGNAAARSIEMVYPICVDAERFVEYLCEMVACADGVLKWSISKELVFDVIDRETRRKYGKCTVPLVVNAATAPGNTRGPQPNDMTEHSLRQLRRDNALYEIKSVEPDERGDMIGGDRCQSWLSCGYRLVLGIVYADAIMCVRLFILLEGYLAVNLDVQFKNQDFRAHSEGEDERLSPLLYPGSRDSESPPSVLVPRSRPTVHINVHRDFDVEVAQGDHAFPFDSASSISYMESDALHSFPGSSPRSADVYSSRGSLSFPSEMRNRRSDPTRHLVLHDLIEKGKALQQSMAKAADESLDRLPEESVAFTVPRGQNDGIHPYTNLATYQHVAEDGDDGDTNPPSWETVLKQAPPRHLEHRVAHGTTEKSGNADSSLPPSVNGLEITFESLEFGSEFLDQLQQLRDSTISSRFSPIELSVSHSDVSALLSPHSGNSANPNETSSSLFSVATSLRKRVLRLSYSHVVPFRPHGGSLATHHLTSNMNRKSQLQFDIRCQTQGTPRRTPRRKQQDSRSGQNDHVALRGVIPARDIFQDAVPRKDPWVVNVQLFIHDESITSSQNAKPATPRTRRRKNPQSVGEMKVKFLFCSFEAESSGSEINGSNHMIFSSASSSPRSIEEGLQAPRPLPARRAMREYKQQRTPDVNGQRVVQTNAKTIVQLAVVIERATSIRFAENRARKTRGSNQADFVLRVEYAVPPICYVNSSLSSVDSVKRTIRRKLLRAPSSHVRAPPYHASVNHAGVFSLELDRKLARSFKKQLLIVEVWVQDFHAARDDEGQLLGLVKIPFDAFSSCFRDGSGDWDHTEPFVGVDDHLPIVDPFSGKTSGYLHTRIAIGTAQQIITLTTTTRAITRFQAIVRGALSRKTHVSFRTSKPHHDGTDSSPLPGPSAFTEDLRDRGSQRVTLQSSEIPAPSRSGEAARNISHRLGDDFASAGSITASDTFLHEIRIEIRECWSVARVGGTKEQASRNQSPSILGCELQGELLVHGDRRTHPSEPKAVQFALWWDASNRQLNSHFVHSFRSKEHIKTAGASGIRGVAFAFHVQNDFIRSSSAQPVSGRAALDLRHFFASERDAEATTGKLVHIRQDIDIPIEWQQQEGSKALLCSVLPLQISYQVSANASTPSTQFHPIELLDASRVLEDERSLSNWMKTTAVSTTRRLLPATITLSTKIHSISDVKHAIEERWSQVCANPSDVQLKKHLETVLRRESVTMMFECNACLGVEIDEASADSRDEIVNSFRLYKQNGRWYKTFRLTTAHIDVTNRKQVLSSLLPSTQVSIVVHPEVLQSLQDDCLDIKIFSRCEEGDAEYELGVVSVPVAAVLFRPTGVQGTFPIQVGEVLSGRLGVQVSIDHQRDGEMLDENSISVDSLKQGADESTLPASTSHPASPTTPEEGADQFSTDEDQQMQSIQISVEDIRNVQRTDSMSVGDDMRDYFVTFAIRHGDEEWIDLLPVEGATTIAAESRINQVSDYKADAHLSSHVWDNATLKVSVWGGVDGDFSKHARSVCEKNTIASDRNAMVIGRAFVDLSLFHAGWRAIHGWYHVLDGQQISRGQVKIRAALCTAESGTAATEKGDVEMMDHQRSETIEELERTTEEQTRSLGFGSPDIVLDECRVGSSSSDNSPSLSDALHSVTQASREIQEGMEYLSPSSFVGGERHSGQDSSLGTDPAIEPADILDGAVHTPVDSDQSDDAMISNPDNEIDITPTDHLDTDALSSSVLEDDEMVETEEEHSPVLNAGSDFYQPITLSSFGIEEIQFSPLSDKLSPQPSVDDQELGNPVSTGNGESAEGRQELETVIPELGNSSVVNDAASSVPSLHGSPEDSAEDSSPLSISRLSEGDLESVQKERVDVQISGDSEAGSVVNTGGDIDAVHDSQPKEEDPTPLDTSYFSLDGVDSSKEEEPCISLAEKDEPTTLSDSVGADDFSAEDVADFSLVTGSNAGIDLPDESDQEEHWDRASPFSENEDFGNEGDEKRSNALTESDFKEMGVGSSDIACDEKSTQVDEEVIVTDKNLGDNVHAATDDGTVVAAPDESSFTLNSDLSDPGERTVLGDAETQWQHLDDSTSAKASVDAACGTSDDPSHLDDHLVSSEQKILTDLGSSAIAAKEERASNKRAEQACLDRRVTCPVESDAASIQEVVPRETQSGGAASASVSDGLSVGVQEGTSKQALLCLSAEKFELICQLLSEIRDSCGPKIVKDILQSQVPEAKRGDQRPDTQDRNDNHAVVCGDETLFAPPPSPTLMHSRLSALNDVDLEQSGVGERRNTATSSIKRADRALPRKYSIGEDFASSCWSDSSTLQREIERRMKWSKAASSHHQSFRASGETNVRRNGASRFEGSRDGDVDRFFDGDHEAIAPPSLAFRPRQGSEKPHSYKADSETERIARIMQGSINYWRKGEDERLDGSDDDSFDSGDDDCFF